MKIKDQPFSIRPREKMIAFGAENLSEEELLAIIISSGTKGKNAIQLGKEIIKKSGNNVFTISIENLCEIKGLGYVKALKLKAAFELGLRYAKLISGKVIVNTSKDVYLLLHEFIYKKQEHLILLCLNARNQLISKKVVTVGTLDSSLFHPREIFAEALQDRASKIIIAHNHPSGSLEASPNDLAMTSQLKRGGLLMGIELVDSLILSEEGYKSIIGDNKK